MDTRKGLSARAIRLAELGMTTRLPPPRFVVVIEGHGGMAEYSREEDANEAAKELRQEYPGLIIEVQVKWPAA